MIHAWPRLVHLSFPTQVTSYITIRRRDLCWQEMNIKLYTLASEPNRIPFAVEPCRSKMLLSYRERLKGMLVLRGTA